MSSIRRLLPVLLAAAPLGAQRPTTPAPASATAPAAAPVDTVAESDDEGVPLGLQYGVATGALAYQGGRSEQALGGVFRWAPLRWFSIGATPTAVRVHEPALSPLVPAMSRSGLVDLPIEATLSHAFQASFSPTLSGGLGVTLPVGDTAGGFGSGKVGYALSAGLGFAPTSKLWVHLGAGRSLTRFSVGSAFAGGNGWGDASAGLSLTDHLSASAGYSTDLGAADSTVGRSASVNGGLAIAVRGATTMHFNASHGISGLAPRWSFGLAFGTAFPYLNHLGAGSGIDQLRNTFGGGTHGLSSGSGTSGSSSGRGRRP
jgi:hypothetical protein